MKKSKDITKYNLKWQMIRASIKGSDTTLEEKLAKVNSYFNEEKTIDAYEKVLNYLEGLQMGYKGKDYGFSKDGGNQLCANRLQFNNG